MDRGGERSYGNITVGYQVEVLGHAIEAAAPGGTVCCFGAADADTYPINMRTMLCNHLTPKSGVTLNGRWVLDAANTFAAHHPRLLGDYLSRTFAVQDGQDPFELARRADPDGAKIAAVDPGAR